MTATRSWHIPTTEMEWRAEASKHNLAAVSLKAVQDLQSASNVTKEQFLLFRTLIQVHRPRAFNPAHFNMGHQFQRASEVLESSQEFQSYINAIRTSGWDALGDFGLVRKQQKEVILSTTNTGNKLTDKDETPVNSTLIGLLQAITLCKKNAPTQWRHSEIPLVADFGRVRNEKTNRHFVAKTDGQLQHINTHQIRALVECKNKMRSRGSRKIDMQEAAELVAWMKEYPQTSFPRVLVSQDDTEIFITFAQYNGDWINYLKYSRAGSTGFMTMTRFGPWSITVANDMEQVARIVLALSL